MRMRRTRRDEFVQEALLLPLRQDAKLGKDIVTDNNLCTRFESRDDVPQNLDAVLV